MLLASLVTLRRHTISQKNLVSLTLSHVKVELDLTEQAPTVVEFERESGEVVEVNVTYLWLPLTCSHCHELGHVIRNCPSWTPPEKTETQSQKTPAKGKSKNKHKEVLKASTSTPTADLEVNNMPPSSTAVEVVTDNVLQDLNSSHSSLLFTYVHKKKHSFSKKKASTKKPSHTITAPSSQKKNLSPSDFMEKKKLKRTRSDPSFDSPPHQSTCTHLHYHSA